MYLSFRTSISFFWVSNLIQHLSLKDTKDKKIKYLRYSNFFKIYKFFVCLKANFSEVFYTLIFVIEKKNKHI